MNKYLLKSYLLTTALIISSVMTAQVNRNKGIIWSAIRGLEYQIKAGFNIGGVSPLPLPSEIRKINSYRPELSFSLGTEITKWFGEDFKYGVITGISFESKSMSTDATVKNYGMELIEQGQKVSGRWTGDVQTKFRSTYLTVPILFGFKVSTRVVLKTGPYFSYVLDRNFSGYVHDGYLRAGDPTGVKTEYKDGKTAPYDFSTDLRKFQWGMRLAAEWRAFEHLNVFGDLNWGLNDAFKKDFKTITFAMYPIYLNVGFGYAF